MKKIILDNALQEIPLGRLMGNELIAYKAANSTNYVILARVFKGTKENNWVDLYGFIGIGDSQSPPRFTANTWKGAIETAGKQRKLYTFANPEEFYKAVLNKEF